jgi:hypothetical protein
LSDLPQLVVSPLNVKFPYESEETVQKCPAMMTHSLNDMCDPDFLQPVIKLSFEFSDSVNANISLWDRIVKSPLEEVSRRSGLILDFGRNHEDRSTTIFSKRPDFIVWLKGVLVLKGEEKGPKKDFHVAKHELLSKMKKCNINLFGAIPFVFSYAAANCKLQYFAFDRSMNMREISQVFDLNYVADRLTAVLVSLNILKILCDYPDLLPDFSTPMYQEINRNNGTVTIYEDHVVKQMVSSPFDPQSVDEIYNSISAGCIRCSVKRMRRSDCGLKFKMAPVGFLKKPSDRRGWINALKCVAMALSDMHSLGFVHRDIRWENIVCISPNSYILIDFENSGRTGSPLPVELLESRVIDPKIGLDALEYSTDSDMFQFGKLIENQDPDFVALRDNLTRETQRLTAVEVLDILDQMANDDQ